jgi:predicted metalloendopeptidase
MDSPTRAEALKKLGNFEVRVGYPNKWRDYSALQIDKAQAVRERDERSQVRVEPPDRAPRQAGRP